MANLFYTFSTAVVNNTLAVAAAINDMGNALVASFDKLPTEIELKDGTVNYQGADTGAADAYVVALPYAPSVYRDGLRCSFVPANTNAGASTIDASGLGVKSATHIDGSAFSAGELVAGQPYDFIFNTTADAFKLTSLFGDIGTSAASATAAAASAVAAAASAVDAADAVNGVKVSADDTTPGDLEAKIAAGALITLATLNPGANEQRQFNVTGVMRTDGAVASQADQDMAGFSILKGSLKKASDDTVSTTTTKTFNFNDGGIQKVTFSGSVTITLAVSNFPTADGAGIIIDAVNWGVVTSVSIPAAWKFEGGIAPAFTVSGLDRLVLYHDGDNLYSLHVVDLNVKAV